MKGIGVDIIDLERLDVENLKNDLAIENMYVTDDDISMLRKISNNEITINQAIHDIIKGDYNV